MGVEIKSMGEQVLADLQGTTSVMDVTKRQHRTIYEKEEEEEEEESTVTLGNKQAAISLFT